MTRELRLRPAGILFYTVLALSLVATQVSEDFLRNLPSQPAQADIYQAVTAILGLGALLFTSDAIGYVFSTVHVFLWNIVRGRFRQGSGGYSAEWHRLGYDLKGHIVQQYKNTPTTPNDTVNHLKFEKQWESYSADVFLSYFWQQAPSGIVDWAMRRHTAFFAGMSTVIGIGLGLALSAIIIWAWKLGWTPTNTGIAITSVVLALVIYRNAQYSRSEAWQIIDLWLAGKLNPRLRTVLDELRVH